MNQTGLGYIYCIRHCEWESRTKSVALCNLFRLSLAEQGAGLNSSIAVIEEHRSTCCRWELYISVYSAHPASQSGRRRRRLRFQAKGLFHSSPGHSPWVRGPVFPSQAKGLLHRFEAVALEAE